ncbi:hypothetical protein [Flavobacterium sp.]|uniref:hypothetical protein n=1 Tax=Flavobacterium sp. TaxID=239 RepID=UPI0038FC028B
MKKILLVLTVFAILTSCSKNEVQITPELPVNIYAAGRGQNSSATMRQAVVWKNGVPTYLTDGTREGYAYSVFVKNNDVHVAGHEKNTNGILEGKYWKNGVLQNLNINTTVGSTCVSVFVYNDDVYVLGTNNGAVVYWKNGVQNTVTGIGTAIPTSIVVTFNSVYVLVTENNSVKVWKNGVITTLSDGIKSDEAKSLCIENGNVFVLAEETYNAQKKIKYWRSGVLTYLTSTSNNIYAFSIAVSNGNVCIGGIEANKAKYWLNGIPNNVSNSTSNSVIYALTYFNGTIYSTGFDNGIMKFWENATDLNITITSVNNDPYSIFVAN